MYCQGEDRRAFLRIQSMRRIRGDLKEQERCELEGIGSGSQGLSALSQDFWGQCGWGGEHSQPWGRSEQGMSGYQCKAVISTEEMGER